MRRHHVVAIGQGRGVDRVAAHVLASCTAQGAGQAVARHQIALRDLVRQARIDIAVDLAFRIGRYRDRAGGDAQGAVVRRHHIVAVGQGRGVDRVAAHVFTGCAAQHAAQAVAFHQRTFRHLVSQARIDIAVHLALRIGGHHDGTRVDAGADAAGVQHIIAVGQAQGAGIETAVAAGIAAADSGRTGDRGRAVAIDQARQDEARIKRAAAIVGFRHGHVQRTGRHRPVDRAARRQGIARLAQHQASVVADRIDAGRRSRRGRAQPGNRAARAGIANQRAAAQRIVQRIVKDGQVAIHAAAWRQADIHGFGGVAGGIVDGNDGVLQLRHGRRRVIHGQASGLSRCQVGQAQEHGIAAVRLAGSYGRAPRIHADGIYKLTTTCVYGIDACRGGVKQNRRTARRAIGFSHHDGIRCARTIGQGNERTRHDIAFDLVISVRETDKVVARSQPHADIRQRRRAQIGEPAVHVDEGLAYLQGVSVRDAGRLVQAAEMKRPRRHDRSDAFLVAGDVQGTVAQRRGVTTAHIHAGEVVAHTGEVAAHAIGDQNLSIDVPRIGAIAASGYGKFQRAPVGQCIPAVTARGGIVEIIGRL